MTFSPDDRKWMLCALEEAALSGKDVPVGCVVVLDDEVIGRGHNEREATGDPTAHAELVAIRQAAQTIKHWRLTGATAYSTLEPCPMCAEAMIQARVARVVYGAFDHLSGAAGSMVNLFKAGRLYPVPEVLGGLEEEACSKLLTDFFGKKRR
jgi:tRNA(adenine34) deaminase